MDDRTYMPGLPVFIKAITTLYRGNGHIIQGELDHHTIQGEYLFLTTTLYRGKLDPHPIQGELEHHSLQGETR